MMSLAQPRMARCSAQFELGLTSPLPAPPTAQSWNLINEPRFFANQTQCSSDPTQCTQAIQGEAAA